MKKGSLFAVWLATGLVLASAAFAADDAAGVLLESGAAYASLKTYSDTGVATHPDFGDLTFDTAFERPERFRFAFKDGHPFVLLRFLTTEHIVRDDGRRVTTWTVSSGKEPVEVIDASLALAVAGATGVSRGSAHRIATLLMPHLWDHDAFGSSILALSEPKLLGDASIEGVPCRDVSGRTKRGMAVEVWIARSDHLIRRIDTRDSQGVVESEVRRDIRIDAVIPPATFDTHAAPRRVGERAS